MVSLVAFLCAPFMLKGVPHLMDTIETKTNDATTNTVPINDSLKLITMKLENINKGIFVTITVKM
ncbi:hypothetical protein ABE36_12980 [Bacillus subtilis]|nr:hypothetical protein AWV81_02990 [Bacillus subtilis subsp. natto]API96072.1 hypothetical protein BKP58_09335 [Bacillus subtilis]MBG9562043.1 hypothetical protein [Bacillus subtilis]RAM55412.1 hypothetical protein DI05_19810 [Bacillus subtilis]